ncbi:MAG: hypothetical protein M0P02_04060 [Sulfurospirillaceae bacterium]|jgi:hypothetical protein|nr:hypothetical protein [Sulfurospirillaceae bacterium]MCK9545873.1 hypothetical protein [Sulfurospirillaceae bacterium]NLM99087.1 hypothetical protein [Campylobacteraceae bacterium]
MTNDAILTQLGYSVNAGAMAQLNYAISNTPGFESISKHIINLHLHLKPYLSFVALSSTKPFFKVKNMAAQEDSIEEVDGIILKWAEKFKIGVEKVNPKTYYIVGFEKV